MSGASVWWMLSNHGKPLLTGNFLLRVRFIKHIKYSISLKLRGSKCSSLYTHFNDNMIRFYIYVSNVRVRTRLEFTQRMKESSILFKIIVVFNVFVERILSNKVLSTNRSWIEKFFEITYTLSRCKRFIWKNTFKNNKPPQ